MKTKPIFDLAHEMQAVINITDTTSSKSKLSIALNHLELAANGLEQLNATVDVSNGLETVTNVVESLVDKIAKKKPEPKIDRDGRIKELDRMMEKEYAGNGKSSLFEAMLQEQERLLRSHIEEKFPAKKDS